MRSPAEAQSDGGEGGKRVARLPSQIWPHDNKSLMKACINYHVHYLGSVLVKKLHGKQSAEEACLKLRVRTPFILTSLPFILISLPFILTSLPFILTSLPFIPHLIHSFADVYDEHEEDTRHHTLRLLERCQVCRCPV